MSDIAEQLREAARKARQSTAERDRLIVEARQGGMSLREIAAHVGLTHAGVNRIVKRHVGQPCAAPSSPQ